jgi:hypothetical protein
VVTGPTPSRTLLLCLVVALPFAGAAIACTPGDEIAYTSSAVTGEGGTPDDSGRIVGDSSVDVIERPSDGGTIPPLVTVACPFLDPDGGCDPTAGMGCCLPKSGAVDSAAANTCAEQIQFFSEATTFCKTPGDVFLTCLASDSDNLCCWAAGANGTQYTARKSSCEKGVESCNPLVGGTTCSNGQPCVKAKCKGLDVGACGKAPPCTP